MAFKIEVTDDCIGCGACAAQCDMFEMAEKDGSMKAKPKKDKVADKGCAQEAVDICPVSAIKLSPAK